MAADLLLPVLRHHRPVPEVIVAGRKIEAVELEVELEFRPRGLHHAHALGNVFLGDALPGDDGEPVGAIGRAAWCRHCDPLLICLWPGRIIAAPPRVANSFLNPGTSVSAA